MTDKQRIRILLVDDHAIVRDGIRSLLATTPDVEVVGEADNGRDAIEMAERLQPDVILMDLMMPEIDGVEATRQIVARRPEARILVLTSFAGHDQVFSAIRAGAAGYLLKDADAQELVRAIHQIFHGESTLHSRVASMLLQEIRTESPPRPVDEQAPSPGPLAAGSQRPGRETAEASSPLTPLQAAKLRYAGLTSREREVAALIAQGKSNAAIAGELVLTVRTVEAHVTHILDKLGFDSRTQIAAWAAGRGLAAPPSAPEDQAGSE
jgi:DNA-binding NarL/FixJ family response regulator